MWKKLIIIFSIFSIFTIHSFTQESETQTITITEDEINNALGDMLAGRNVEIHITASLKSGVVMVNVVGTSSNGSEFNLELVAIASISLNYTEVEWTLVDWTVTDSEGNELTLDEERIFTTTESFLGRWRELILQLLRRKIGERQAPSIQSVNITEDGIVIEYQIGDSGRDGVDRQDNLPSNITPNEDGTFTIRISQDMINDAFAVIVERNENLSHFVVEIEGINAGHFRVELQARSLCNNEVIEGAFTFASPEDLLQEANDNQQFIIGDWNGDGIDDVASIFIPGRYYAVLENPMTCNGEALTLEQNQNVMSLLLPAVQRFVRLQVRNSWIVDFEVVGDTFELTVEPQQD